jgi:di/tripeptidase
MITEAMVNAAWRAAPAPVRELLDPDEVRRMVAAAEAERPHLEVSVPIGGGQVNAVPRAGFVIWQADATIPQRPDAEGDW